MLQLVAPSPVNSLNYRNILSSLRVHLLVCIIAACCKDKCIVIWAAEMIDSYSGIQADSQGCSEVADVLYHFTSSFCSSDESTESWPVKYEVPQSRERATG